MYFPVYRTIAGWRYSDAQERRTRQDWARQIDWLLAEQYPKAKKIVLVMDNLNTHNIASLYATFPPQHARELAERLGIITLRSTEAGLILQRLNFPFLVANALQTT